MTKHLFSSKLRIEKSAQVSGPVAVQKISKLKECHYHILDIPLQGDAPKQYIKAYFYSKNCPRSSKPKTWAGYYAKTGGKSYPHESIVEYAINKVGDALGLNMNETNLVVVNNQIRFLSKDFIKKDKRLIHGTEILAEYLEDRLFVDEINKDRELRREYFTFDVVEEAIRHVYSKWQEDILTDLVKMITFDALIGNKDRHFYNWGVIGSTFRSDDDIVQFSPIYDSARGLLWNMTEKKILDTCHRYKTDPKVIHRYLDKSDPRFSFEGNPKANHFDLIKFLVTYDTRYASIIESLSSLDMQRKAIASLHATIGHLFSKERTYLMIEVLQLRFERVRTML